MQKFFDAAKEPSISDFSAYIRLSLFDDLCREMEEKYSAKYTMDYSGCSMEPGWNLKFKKSGKTLCTVYPREGHFTVMIVIGPKQKQAAAEILAELTLSVRQIYYNTEEGNGQRWMMIDLEDDASVYDDVLRLIEIRRQNK